LIPAVIRRSVAVTFLIALVMGAFAMPAFAGGNQVLADYEDNGQIDGCYTLAEYEAALKAIRPDQQQYGAAVDVIRQAELTNIRRPGGACGGTSASAGSKDVPGGTSPSGETVEPADGSATPAPADDGGIPSVVIALLLAAGLAIMAFVVYVVVTRRGGTDDGDGPGDGTDGDAGNA
jgi:hypothetical protein